MSSRSCTGPRLRLEKAPALALGFALAGCGGVDTTVGLDEPVRVDAAQFRSGPLPGQKPLTAEQLVAGQQPVAPYVTPPESAGRLIAPSATGYQVAGRASPDSHSVGIAVKGQGSGYWVLPVGSPDPNNDGELFWRASLSFGPFLEPGLSTILIAAFDEAGRAGTQRGLELCVRSPVADNLNACDPTREPPALVVSLGWGNDADLDLFVVAPDGSVFGNERTVKEGVVPEARLEADANARCVPTSLPRENVVWSAKPSKGLYLVYVRQSDACGAGATPFSVSMHVGEAVDEEFRQVETFRVAGEFLPEATASVGLGQFVTEFQVD